MPVGVDFIIASATGSQLLEAAESGENTNLTETSDSMAHKVTFEVPQRPVSFKDIVFKVRMNNKKFGELRVSQGAVVWIPAEKSKGRRLSWRQMDQLAQEHGKSIHVGF